MSFTRRHVLGALAAGGAATSGPARAALVRRGTILLLDDSLPAAQLRAAAGAYPRARCVRVGSDLVRLWRNGLANQVCAAKGPVVAFVRWDKAFVLMGLAREDRLLAVSTPLDRSVFHVSLGGRAVDQR